MKSQPKAAGAAASQLITDKIAGLGDWRGKTLARVRALITEADPDVLEEVKWMGTPVWSHDGGICTGETYKSVVKLTFFKGAALKDPRKLFNSSMDGNVTALLSASQSIGVPQPLKIFGTPEQKKRFFPLLAKGAISAFALTENHWGEQSVRSEFRWRF